MRKNFCDRCEKEIPDRTMHWINAKETYRRVIFFTPIGMSRDIQAPKEICQDCMDEFYHWWAEGKNEST